MTETDHKESRLEKIIYAEKLRLFYRQTFPVVFMGLLLAALIVYLLKDVQDQDLLRKWLTLLILVSLARLILFFEFWRRSPAVNDIPKWGKPYFITLFISAAIWGFGIPALMPEKAPVYEVILMFFLMGVVGVSISTYWLYQRALIPVVAILILPTTIWLAVKSPEETAAMVVTVFAIGLFISLVRSSFFLSQTLTDNLQRNHELEDEKKKVEYLSRRDELTNLYNHRAFYEQLNEIGAYCERHKESIAVIIADIDKLKDINKRYGQDVGDRVLAKVGKLFKKHTRTSDICARIGGEEFGILIRSSSLEEGEKLAEKLNEIVRATDMEAGGQVLHVTASFGVACSNTDFGNTVRQADKAMYEAKAQGGGRVLSEIA